MLESEILHHLTHGTIEMDGYVPWGSNYTVVVTSVYEKNEMTAVYKPRKGERPLWDFPTGTLCNRERAAFLVSQAAEWNIVPPTVLTKGPQGLGSLQLFIEHDPNVHFFNFENKENLHDSLKKICLFDVIINNADRKGGHVIQEDVSTTGDELDAGDADRLWAIDHGIAFHDEPKLRSVIWDYAGEPISEDLLDALARLESSLASSAEDSLGVQLRQLLSEREMQAFGRRIQRMHQIRVFPEPGPGRPYPWPMV
ncbi:MAG: SCO1664 family protein [Anaerolineae bacterium]